MTIRDCGGAYSRRRRSAANGSTPTRHWPAATNGCERIGATCNPAALVVGQNVLLLGTQPYSPPITVIARDLARRAAAACSLLLETIARQDGRAIMLPTELIVRPSSARQSPG